MASRLRKPRGSSKAGRPRIKGARYASGDLKRPGPNEAVIAQRKALCDDPRMATNPLDCAFANGWIPKVDYATAREYAQTFRDCGFGMGRVTASTHQEVEARGELSKLSISQMPFSMIAEAWDKVMDGGYGIRQQSDGRPMADWKAINAVLDGLQRREIYLICIMESWPFWLTSRLAGRDVRITAEARAKAERNSLTDEEQGRIYKLMHSPHEIKRDILLRGLKAIRNSRVPDSIQSAPRKSRKVADITVYVDEDGEKIREVTRLIPVG